MYESFFGLTGLPFQLNPDPSFLFHGKAHRDAFAALREGLAAGARVMVLTGEVGAGKTTLLQALLASVDPMSTMTMHIAVSGLDAEMLSNRVLEALGNSAISDPVARRDALLTTIGSGPRATLLVIDEAQHLDASAFELLEAMAGAAAQGRLQICLVGQPELRFLINAPEREAFRELIDVDRHLRPLEQSEIRLYVEHRLHRAGWTGRPEFEDAAFTEIFIFTAGIPRRVNLLCNSLMLTAWIKRQARIDAPAVARAAGALRGDSAQAAPDLLELAAHAERPPTLTEAIEPGPPVQSETTRGDGPPPWSCPSCAAVNPASVLECWKCDTPRPDMRAVPPREAVVRLNAADRDGEVMSDAAHGSFAPSDAMHTDVAVSAQTGNDLPPLTLSDGTPQDDGAPRGEPINAQLAGLVQGEESRPRRSRVTILATAASIAVALAAIAYIVERQNPDATVAEKTLREVVSTRAVTAGSPAPAFEATPSAAASPGPAASSSLSSPLGGAASGEARRENKTAPDRDVVQNAAAGQQPETAATSSEADLAPTPAEAAPPVSPSCSGPASALGLCDTERSSPTRRQ